MYFDPRVDIQFQTNPIEGNFMSALTDLVAEKANLSPEQADNAIAAVVDFIKAKVPESMQGWVDKIVGEDTDGDGDLDGGLIDMAGGMLGGLFGGKKEEPTEEAS